MNLKTKLQMQLVSAQRVSPFAAKSDESGGIPWWALLPSLLVVTAVIVWLWIRQESYETELPAYIPERYPPRPVPEEPKPAVTEYQAQTLTEEARIESSEKDDLKLIEGIGPKIALVFQNVGIHTFAQLAETDTSRLEEILRGSGIRIANPETWPEQAAFAAKGDWEGLKELQEHLKGGRRV